MHIPATSYASATNDVHFQVSEAYVIQGSKLYYSIFASAKDLSLKGITSFFAFPIRKAPITSALV